MQQSTHSSAVSAIDVAALRSRQQANSGLVLVEALPASYFTSGHLPGAINLPHDATDSMVSSALPNRSAETVIYCASASCPNSHLLARRLSNLGFSRVSVFTEGKAGWLNAGGALQR